MRPYERNVLDLIETVRRQGYEEGFQAGHAEAIQKIMSAAGQASPPPNGVPSKASSEEGEKATVKPARARPGERDAAVMAYITASIGGLTATEVNQAFADDGVTVGASSVECVLKRLVKSGRIQKNGRVYVLSGKEPSQAPGEVSSKDDEPQPFRANGSAANGHGSHHDAFGFGSHPG